MRKGESMAKSLYVLETPKDCLHCKMRKVLHIRDKYYQMCSLCTDGYCTESFFKTKDLKDGWISPKCPLVDEEEYICNSEIYKEVTDIGYIAKHYDVDAILDAQNE